MPDLTTLLSKFLTQLYAGTVDIGATGDALLVRDAANTIAQRNGTNAQAFRVYNTSANSNVDFERLNLDWSANEARIFTSQGGTGSARNLNLGANGSVQWRINTSGNLLALTDNSFDIGASGATRPKDLYLAGAARQIGSQTTTGALGAVGVVASGRATAQTAANASVSTVTVGAADASFEVSANVLVTTATTHTFTVECAYTDEGNTARTVTMTFRLVASPTTLTTSIANGNGAVPYNGDTLHIRAKAATTITIRTQAAGTYTTVTYNIEGIIKRTA